MAERTLSPSELVTPDWRVHGSIYRSPAIFERELETVFSKCWIFVAHESEIAAPGDYKLATIGRQPVIVTRDADSSEIHVIFNRCRHRGSAVCQRAQGNANYFRCSYHGWTYGSDGRLIGVPFDDAYGADFDKSALGLVHVPRVSSYRGFVFANLDPDAISLEEYLGLAAPYLDYVADLGDDGIELSAGAQRYEYAANWKLQVENTIDLYHVSFTHKSWFDVLSANAGKRVPFVKNMTESEIWRTLDFGGGHAAHEYRQLDAGAGSAGHDAGIGELLPFNLVIFPNLGFVGAHMRVITPTAADQTTVALYPIVVKGDPAATERALRDHEAFYGAAGAGTSDDIEVGFDRVAGGLSATATDEDYVIMARGVDREEVYENGVKRGRPTDELPQRAFYGRWQQLIAEGGEL
jgi:phenylpropionate dioxygenase-like ring-hydroxylating dioxygenase large terminal subunit